jgi:hypothetical protein
VRIPNDDRFGVIGQGDATIRSASAPGGRLTLEVVRLVGPKKQKLNCSVIRLPEGPSTSAKEPGKRTLKGERQRMTLPALS